MIDTEKRYYIVDTRGNFYKVREGQGLSVVTSSDEADTFSLREANDRIGSGRKARFYSLIEATSTPVAVATDEPSYDAPEYDTIEKPTMFDGLQNDWEGMLTNLCYMSSHIEEYQTNLNQMLSDVDKEICDILHYIEFGAETDADMLRASKMLKERRCRRREIKNEMEKTDLMRDTFLDGAFNIKIHQSLEIMERMKTRCYTPRKLPELFVKAS